MIHILHIGIQIDVQSSTFWGRGGSKTPCNFFNGEWADPEHSVKYFWEGDREDPEHPVQIFLGG